MKKAGLEILWLLSLLFAFIIGSGLGENVVNAAPASSCQPPAQTWATLVACKTQTAAAQSGQPSPTVTVMASPTFTTVPTLAATAVPTQTPQPTLPPFVFDVAGHPYTCPGMAFYPLADGDVLVVGKCKDVRAPDVTPTRMPTVTALP